MNHESKCDDTGLFGVSLRNLDLSDDFDFAVNNKENCGKRVVFGVSFRNLDL